MTEKGFTPLQAIDKKTGILMEVWRSSNRNDNGREVYVSLGGFRYSPDELTFPEGPVVPQKIYAVLNNVHEFDDLDSGGMSPVLLTFNADNARKFYDRLVSQARLKGKESRECHGEDFYEEAPDNTDTQFCFYLGKWCYTYRMEEYLMDSERIKPREK